MRSNENAVVNCSQIHNSLYSSFTFTTQIQSSLMALNAEVRELFDKEDSLSGSFLTRICCSFGPFQFLYSILYFVSLFVCFVVIK